MKRVLIRCAAAAALFTTLAVWRAGEGYTVFPNPLAFDLTLEPGEAGRSDPVIVSGRPGAGDFLSVRFADARTVRFIYDCWGYPGITSQPITIEPGARLRMSVEMPALDQVLGTLIPPSDLVRVRVICNGSTLLDTNGHFHPREPHQIFFGENPIGGTACGPVLRGRITGSDGSVLRGDSVSKLSLRERLSVWFARYPHQAAALALLSLAVAFFGGQLARAPAAVGAVLRAVRRHRWFVGATALATFGYAWLVTLGSFELFYAEDFGSFYDYQAAGLLAGRLDVPNAGIGGEAFEARGKLYGYFGPTPALLRMPFAVSRVAFAELSRGFMLAYFVGSLFASYLILRTALRFTRAGSEAEREALPSPFAVIVLVASVGYGSTIFFLGSRSLVYHEAILAGIVFALWSAWCSLRHLREPVGRWWLGAFGCGVASIHARPPTGLFALTLLGCVVLAILVRDGRAAWTPKKLRRPLAIGTLCALGVLSLNGLSWLKFRTFDPAPLAISRPYADPARLSRIDGKSFHVANLPFNFDAYILRPNFRLEPRFPWIYLETLTPRRDFPGAKMDLPDHTLALPYSMPSLFALTTLGCLGAFFFRPETRTAVVVLWAAVLPMALALFAAVATAQRYTGDFCPFLIAAAAFGLAACECASRAWRAALRCALAVVTLGAVAVTVAITVHYQGEVLWGVTEETRVNYQNLRRRVDAFLGVPPPPPTPPAPQPRTVIDP